MFGAPVDSVAVDFGMTAFFFNHLVGPYGQCDELDCRYTCMKAHCTCLNANKREQQ